MDCVSMERSDIGFLFEFANCEANQQSQEYAGYEAEGK